MNSSSVRPADEMETVVRSYGDTLYRLCFVMLGNESDAEDAVQDAFIKYMQKAPQFKSADHEKAWLITVAKNRCRDILRFRKRHPQIDSDDLQEMPVSMPDGAILEALMSLPEKYRLVLMLYYVEEYPIDDIARMIGKTASAVKMRLQKGRKLLEEVYRKEYL